MCVFHTLAAFVFLIPIITAACRLSKCVPKKKKKKEEIVLITPNRVRTTADAGCTDE